MLICATKLTTAHLCEKRAAELVDFDPKGSLEFMEKTAKISVLIPLDDAHRFEEYCLRQGHKKSTLIVRLIREHLDSNNDGSTKRPATRRPKSHAID